MKYLKDLSFIAIILLLIAIVTACYNKMQFYKKLSLIAPDTVYVSKPYKVIVIKREYIEKPIKVLVYKKDTTLRKQAEHSDIITGIDLTPSLLTIDKIKPTGEIFSSQYNLPRFREIQIDGLGNAHIKKRRYIGLKILSGVLLAGTATYFITR